MGTEKRARQKANRALGQEQAAKQESRRKSLRWAAIGAGGLVAVIVAVWIASLLTGSDDDPAPTTTLAPVTTVEPTVTDPATATNGTDE